MSHPPPLTSLQNHPKQKKLIDMPRKHFKEAANKLSSMLFLLRDSDEILDELITHMRDSEKIETLSETFALMFFDNLSSNNKNANLIRKLYRILSVFAASSFPVSFA